MRSVFSSIVFCVLILFAGLSQAQEITVSVAAQTVLSDSEITLGKLAAISGADSERVEELSRLKIGDAPVAGRSIVLSMDTFGARLLNKGVDLSGINWQVPPYIKITAASQVLKGDSIVSEAKKYLLSRFKEKSPDDLTITLLSKQPDLILPPGELTMRANIARGLGTGGNANVDVLISVEGQLKTTAKVRFQVHLFEDVVVTAKSINAGSILTLDNLKTERRNIAKNSSSIEYITNLNEVLGLTVRRSLGPHLVLDKSALAKPTIIKRSQEITIIAKKGGIEVAVAGIAMQDGYEGQVIRIQNKASRKMISAKVIDANTVKIPIYGGE